MVRETFESAVLLGRKTLLALDVPENEADAIIADLRRRDAERFALEVAGGRFAGRDLVLHNVSKVAKAPPEAA